MTLPTPAPEEVQQQASKILSQVAGYVGVRTMEIGLRLGLFEEIAKHADGISADALAKEKALDPFYTQVWCRAAYASEVLELSGSETYRLAPHMDKLLLGEDFPGFAGGLPAIMVQPEIFDYFAERLPSGERIWWDQCSPAFIQMVSQTARHLSRWSARPPGRSIPASSRGVYRGCRGCRIGWPGEAACWTSPAASGSA